MTQENGRWGWLSYGLIVMAFTHTLTHIFAGIAPTLYPEFIVEFGLTNQDLGLLASIPSLCAALLSIPIGLMADKIGAKKMILISIAVAIAGAVLAYSATTPFTLILGLSLLIVNTTIYHPASYSFTTFLFKPEDRPKALGIHGAGGTLGMTLGPISLTLLIGSLAFNWRQVYLFWVAPLILGTISVWFIKYIPSEDISTESDEKSSGQATKLLSRGLIIFLIFVAVRMMGMSMNRAFMNVWLADTKGWGLATRGIITGANTLMGLVAAPVGGILATRYGEKKWTVWTLIAAYICYTLAYVLPGDTTFIVFYVASGLFTFLSMAANSAIMAKLSPSGQRGLGYALYFLPGSVMGAIAPMIAAFIADNFGVYNVFMACIGVYFLAVAVLQFGVKVD
ncbi:MFS transporter [Candidatus Bathyarchaeota archaeon]|nr:MFS transporter [Candidatus Bathyarchaeota archaeon]